MRKVIELFVCITLMFFSVAINAQAVGLINMEGDADPYVGTAGWGSGEDDTLSEVNLFLKDWNLIHTSDDDWPLPEAIILFEPIGQSYGDIYQPIHITWKGDWTYLSARYGPVVGPFYFSDIFNIAGIDGSKGITWEGYRKQPLSRIRLYNSTSIPEPATIFLLGAGLIGLIVIIRNKYIRNGYRKLPL